eukprot:SAG11_NODE_7475_length_1138_cov_2.764196_2_plen_93_part_00
MDLLLVYSCIAVLYLGTCKFRSFRRHLFYSILVLLVVVVISTTMVTFKNLVVPVLLDLTYLFIVRNLVVITNIVVVLNTLDLSTGTSRTSRF